MSAPLITPAFRHPEAFRLLRYRCEVCGFVEVVWNSRDGVTPLVIDCARLSNPGVLDALLPKAPTVADLMALDALRGMTVHVLRATTRGATVSLPSFTACGARSTRFIDRQWIVPDHCRPRHDPAPGERYFRDGIPAEARSIMRARTDQLREEGFPLDEVFVAHILRLGCPSDYPPGWPMLVVRGTDADTLPARRG